MDNISSNNNLTVENNDVIGGNGNGLRDKLKNAANGNGKNFKWLVLLTVIIGTFLGRLDQTIVNLALPKMIDQFGITVSSAGWIATAYILANAVFVPIWGKLGDTIGRKKVYMLGFGIFIFGSVLAGFAWNLSSMIVFRVIQAIASSADYPTAMAIIAVTFREGKERAQALGIWSASFAAAAVFGPLIGGPLIDGFGWRSVFLINLPIGLIGMLMASIFVRESVSENVSHKFDWWGAITLGISLTSLVLVLDKGMDWGWFSLNSLLCYLSVAVFTYIFVRIEKRSDEPIVDLKFFKNTIFLNTLANNFIIFMGMMGSIFLLPIFAQTYLGLNATQTGFLFMPMAFVMVLSAPLGGALTGRIKTKYILMASTMIAAAGIYWFSFLDPKSTVWDVILPLSLMAFGMGFGMAQRTNLVAVAVPQEEIGIASSVLALVRNISGAFGIAVFATILNSSINSNVMKINSLSTLASHAPDKIQQFVSLVILKAQIDAYDHVFMISAIIVAIGSLTALLLKIPDEEKLKEKVHVE